MNWFSRWNTILLFEATFLLLAISQTKIPCSKCYGKGRLNPICQQGCGGHHRPMSRVRRPGGTGTEDSLIKTTRMVRMGCSKCYGQGTKMPKCLLGCSGGKKQTMNPKPTPSVSPSEPVQKTGDDKHFIRMILHRAKNGTTWFAILTVLTTLVSSAVIVSCLYKKKKNKNKVKPFIRNIGRLT